MKSKSPRISEFLNQNSVAHDAMWVFFCEEIERERNEAVARWTVCEQALKAIADHDDGSWAAGKFYNEAKKHGRVTMSGYAICALRDSEKIGREFQKTTLTP